MNSTQGSSIDISFILPCLNEVTALPQVLTSLHESAQQAGLNFEIIIADNDSSDGSQNIVRDFSTRLKKIVLVTEKQKGYGAATRAGIYCARGTYVVCLDADMTYSAHDAVTCAKLLLEKPIAFVIGTRLNPDLPRENMPWTHRYIGTPIIASALKILFKTNISDPNCGLRGFSRALFLKLGCVSTGMEFASETIARASHAQTEFKEFPISYTPRVGESKLRTIRDGMRHAYIILATKLRLLGTQK